MHNELSKNTYLKGINKRKEYIRNIKFKDIDIKNILQLTPNNVYDCWTYNRDKVNAELDKLQCEIKMMVKDFNITGDKYKKMQIKKSIFQRKELINVLDTTLNKWTENLYKNIKYTVKYVLKQSMPKAKDKELDIITSEFGNIISEKKYSDIPFKKLIVIFIRDYKKKLAKQAHDIEYLDLSRENKIKNPFSLNNKLVLSEEKIPMYDRNNLLEKRIATVNPVNTSSYFTRKPMGNVSISVFYGSISKSFNGDTSKDKSLELMLLNCVEAMSKFLYGTLQNQLAELYEEIDKTKPIKIDCEEE